MTVSSVLNREFRQQVLQYEAPVLVAFRSSWCLPSQQMVSMIDDVADRYKDRVKVVAVDIESDPKADRICRQYKVTRLPVLMLFRDGRVADFIGGATSSEDIIDMIDRQLRPVLDVNEYNFNAEVLESQVPVLVYVDATWCSASQELAPIVESTAVEFRGRAKVVRLEFGSANAQLCARYGFLRVPTLAVFHRGQIEDQILGAMRGGAKIDPARPSCVGLTSADNVAQMLEQFVL